MVLNDLLTKQNVITKLVLKDGDKELSKELKVKIMRIRMAYTKIKKKLKNLLNRLLLMNLGLYVLYLEMKNRISVIQNQLISLIQNIKNI